MEGNWKKTLYIVWFVQILSLMSFSFGIPFLPYYIQEMGVSDPDKLRLLTGIISSAPAIGMGIMAPVWGIMSDKFGKKPMLLRALFSSFVILTGLGIVNSVGWVLALRAIQGFLSGTVTAAGALVAAKTPQKNMSFALGILASSTFLGRSIGPAVGGILAEAVGYKLSFILGGVIMLVAFFLILIFIKETKITYAEAKTGSKGGFLKIFTMPIILVLIIIFFMRVGRTVASPYLPLYIQEIRGMIEGSSLTTGIITAGASVATALSALVFTRLGDRYDKRKLVALFLGAGSIAVVPFLAAGTLAWFGIFYALMFFMLGGIDPLIMSYSLTLVPENKRGLLFGIRATVGSIAWAIAPLLGSYMSINYSLKAVFYLIPVFLMFAFMTTLILIKKADIRPLVKSIID